MDAYIAGWASVLNVSLWLVESSLPLPQPKEEWMERRTLKRDKQELLDLQLSLENEIAAKGKIQEQLTNVTSQLSMLET